MEGGIGLNTPLDSVEFQIFPSQNRYEACVWSSDKGENVASGTLEHLLLHSAGVKDLQSKGPNAKFNIEAPDNLNSAEWFTISALTRFLHIVGSPDILSIINDIENEISQLEETRKFQVSLYLKAEDIASSNESKNELVRAMDLRIKALKEELAAAFNRATGAKCSLEDISNLESFSHHFGAEDIRNSLHKFVELVPASRVVDNQSDKRFQNESMNGGVHKVDRSLYNPLPSESDTPVKYGASPAKAAQLERQSSTDSERSFSSEQDQPSVERSRTLIRSASPRRSASPMRRVQIGRSGSRRAATLSIKSLNYFPARERVVSHRDAAGNSSEDEDSEQVPKKSERNVLRMSVQDKISLFESKQRDQTVDTQKTKTLLNASVGATKAVLRRWSSGMAESSAQCGPDIVSEASTPITPTNVAVEVQPESAFNISGCHSSVETAETDFKLDLSEKRASDPLGVQVDIPESKREESGEKYPASAEWSRQKEVELNQLFMKMMEGKPVGHRNTASDNSKNKNSASERRGGFYDHYKQKRDEKLRGEAAGKRAEKEAQLKVMQQFLDERKAEMASTNASDGNRRHTMNKLQKSYKNPTQLVNSRKETPTPTIVKKATSKPSPLPATRKSWPSTPLPRAKGTSTAKTPGPTSAGTTPPGRKPQPASPVPQSNPKVEKLLPRQKTMKVTQNDANKSIKGVNEKKKLAVTKPVKTTKTRVQTPSEENNASGAKPSFYSKVTKKSSVVPLETKPFLRKGSGIGPGVGPVVVKTKAQSQPEESFENSGGPSQAEEKEVVANTSDMANQSQERDFEVPKNCPALDSGTRVSSPQECESESSNQVTANGDDSLTRIEMSEINTGTEEESTISPTAWVEIEEHHDEIIPCKDSPIQIASTANVAPEGFSSPRVRHSLSQMLLEESTEADIVEWGNAENPPAMVYQKDAPKGLKRLLKFARKGKGDSHLTGWSSPLAFSEGEDDAEESKGGKTIAEHILRKSNLHAKNYGQSTASYETYEKNSAQSNLSRFNAHNHQKMQEGHMSASATTSKATRSFFSLSAFRGSKPNENKLPYR